MKIFDFTSGYKGKLLANIRYCGNGGCIITRTDGTAVSIELDRYRFAEDIITGANDNIVDHTNFGVEAICFCSVNEANGALPEYDWMFNASRNWLNENRRLLTLERMPDFDKAV